MLKALIVGADAVEPKYIFNHSDKFPNIWSLIKEGASAEYSAYVQKGYTGSYLSEMNWSSIYTGLSPKEHKILELNQDGIRETPEMKLFSESSPFWHLCNQQGISTGIWAADCCINPIEVDGYVVSAKYTMISEPIEKRTAPRELQVCKKDEFVLDYISGTLPPRVYPKTLAQQGYVFEELRQDDNLAWKAVENYHFQDAISNFAEELDFYYNAIVNTQKEHPVNVLYFYTPTTDLIAHCCMCSDDNDVLLQAYQLLDEFIGKLRNELCPENTLFLSDHGMVNFKDLIDCTDRNIQREAFAARDEVLWLKNGYIAFEAHNGALLFTAHGLKGTFVLAGKDIRHVRLNEMRTLDIYPTLLELLGIEVPVERRGFVLDVFNRSVKNSAKLLKEKEVRYQSIALIQCHQPSTTDIILNELYIEKRFSKITLVGEEKYKEIFLHNPRVFAFVSYENFHSEEYDEVYCGMHNEATKEMKHMRIK